MITSVAQRWRDRCVSYRPVGEILDTRQYEVAAIAGDDEARAFVLRNHYLGSYPAARRRFGLYRRGELVGVTVFSVPVNGRTLNRLPGSDSNAKLELGRLVPLDKVPGNGESFFVARCFAELRREGFEGVVSFSDPVPREDRTGATVFMGHIGGVYQSLSSVYAGRANADSLRLLADGRVFSKRAMQKIRAREQGWRYAAATLEQAGARPLLANEDARLWLREALALTTRGLRHGGNHVYLFGLTKTAKRALPSSLAYPKFRLCRWRPGPCESPRLAALPVAPRACA